MPPVALKTLRPELAAELSRATRGEVRFDPYTRTLYSTDASPYQIEPVGVVIPRSGDDVQATLEIAARYKVPVLARGAASSLAGQTVGAAVIIDFSKYLNRLLEINAEEHWARMEPGLVVDALNAALKPHKLMWGPDPASANRATVGGSLINNATGSHSILYGMAADHALAVDALLSDASTVRFATLEPAALAAKLKAGSREGEIYRGLTEIVAKYDHAIRQNFPRTWRSSSGYALNYLLPPHGYTASQPPAWYSAQPYPPAPGFNVAQLLAGSEGTLAIVTEAKFNLVPLPTARALSIVQFDSIAAACEATPTVLECNPAAVELIDAALLDRTRAIPAYAKKLTFIEGRPAAILVVEFYGESEPELVAQIEKLEAHLKRRGVAKVFLRAMTPDQQANVWGVRKAGQGLLMSMRGNAKPSAFMEDVAVPVARLAEYVRAVEQMFAEFGVQAGIYAHASAGCLHIRPILNMKNAADVAKMRAMTAAVLETARRLGGALSGEHSDGLARSMWNEKLFGPEVYGAFREVKRLFDPEHRLNPGKVVDAPDMTENLRYGPDYHTLPFPKTYLSFENDGGFAGAVEQCNGAAVCRQLTGTMCPSYMTLRDEEHLTRGRANALRAALSGHLPPEELFAPRMHAVLDLCLECKACKAECPSGVDLAKIKYEYLAQYQDRHGVPLRSMLFGYLPELSRMATVVAPLANWALGLTPVRWLNEKLLGIARQRKLPPFARQTFRDWHRQNARRFTPAPNHSVLLFVDTWFNYNHPEIGIAAVRVLEAAGYQVLLARHGCCGRPFISKGMLKQAKAYAARNIKALAPYAEQGIPILGLEPSCLLSMRDEYLDFFPDDPRAKTLAAQCFLIEEFIAAHADEFAPLFRAPTGAEVLVHSHCYQKSITGVEALLKSLRLPGWTVTEINAGCCGMAGAFGYEAEHFEVSMKVGEERLFPAVRAASAETHIAAGGMSCRHQIEHGAGRSARHPIQLLADALVE